MSSRVNLYKVQLQILKEITQISDKIKGKLVRKAAIEETKRSLQNKWEEFQLNNAKLEAHGVNDDQYFKDKVFESTKTMVQTAINALEKLKSEPEEVQEEKQSNLNEMFQQLQKQILKQEEDRLQKEEQQRQEQRQEQQRLQEQMQQMFHLLQLHQQKMQHKAAKDETINEDEDEDFPSQTSSSADIATNEEYAVQENEAVLETKTDGEENNNYSSDSASLENRTTGEIQKTTTTNPNVKTNVTSGEVQKITTTIATDAVAAAGQHEILAGTSSATTGLELQSHVSSHLLVGQNQVIENKVQQVKVKAVYRSDELAKDEDVHLIYYPGAGFEKSGQQRNAKLWSSVPGYFCHKNRKRKIQIRPLIENSSLLNIIC